MVLPLMPKILIVTQQMIIAADLYLQLSKLNFDVVGISNCSEDAIASIMMYETDLILIDIGLKGSVDGITLAKMIKKDYSVPIIYLNPGVNSEVMHDAVQSEPEAFIHIPYEIHDLSRKIIHSKKRNRILQLH